MQHFILIAKVGKIDKSNFHPIYQSFMPQKKNKLHKNSKGNLEIKHMCIWKTDLSEITDNNLLDLLKDIIYEQIL